MSTPHSANANGECLVSVVVPTHNRAAILGEHIESVLAQQAPPHELIYVNDASTDGTQALLESFAKAHPNRVRIVHGEFHGPGPARNAGVRIARGKYLLFTDDDCTVPPRWIERMLARLDRHPCEAISGGFLPYATETPAERYLHHRMRLLFGDCSKPIEAAPMMSFLVSRVAFLDVEGFLQEPLPALEDWWLCHRLAARGVRLWYDPMVRVTHRYQREWAPALDRLRATATCAAMLALRPDAPAQFRWPRLLLRSTARALAAPLWVLGRFPLDLYPVSVKIEWMMYIERLRAFARMRKEQSGP